MEHELFREHLQCIYDYLGGEKIAFVSLSTAAKFCGMDPRTLLADRTFPIKKMGKSYKIPVLGLARWMCAMKLK